MKYKRGTLLKIKKGSNDCVSENYRWVGGAGSGIYKDFLCAFTLDSDDEPRACKLFPPDESFVIVVCSKNKKKARGRIQICHPDAGVFYISTDLVEEIKPNES